MVKISPSILAADLLKLEDEVHSDNQTSLNESMYSENINEVNVNNDEEISKETSINESLVSENQELKESEPSNGLENFGLKEEGSFELFDDNNETQNTIVEEDKENEEDELEIPAFLRRQKN